MSDWLTGRHAVVAALSAGRRRLEAVLTRPGTRLPEEVTRLADGRGVPVREASPDDQRRLEGSAYALRCGEYPYLGERDLPESAGADDLVVVLDRIQDPQNLGAMIRTAEAAGARALCIPERQSAQVTPAVVRASAGAAETLAVHRIVNVARTLERLKKAGFWTVGLDVEGAVPWSEVDYRMPVALVVGAEGEGMRPLVRAGCDWTVTLPMRGHVQSLNASASFAAVVYEVVRQRATAP